MAQLKRDGVHHEVVEKHKDCLIVGQSDYMKFSERLKDIAYRCSEMIQKNEEVVLSG
jgi:hypothetical protein